MDNLDFKIIKEFERIDTKKIISEIDEVINKESDFNEVELDKLRNLNHSNYFELNIEDIKNLPKEYKDEASGIINLYNSIDSIDLLKDDLISAKEHSNIIKIIKKRLNALTNTLLKDLNKIIEENDELENKLELSILSDTNPSKELQRKIIEEKVNSLKFFNLSTNTKNPGFEISRQQKRIEYINQIESLILKYDEELNEKRKQQELNELNERINLEYMKYSNKINDLKKYIKINKNFEDLLERIKTIFNYNKNNYDEAKELLSNVIVNKTIDKELEKYDKILNSVINSPLKMKETSSELKESIRNNYINLLTEGEVQELNNNKYLIKIKQILDKIWKNEITDVNNYVEGNDFKFLCSNINEYKKEVITKLITSEELKYVIDYDNYEVGYIYEFNDNIKSILYKDSEYFDKTPIDLEKIFINKKDALEIKLYPNSKKQAVFYIKNKDFDEDYETAKKLSEEENLLLIVLDLNKYKNR